MLRSLVLILLVVNATFLAWSQGWLKPLVGVQPDAQHDPTRLQQQRHAERITVLNVPAQAGSPLPPASATPPGTPAPTPPSAPASASLPATALAGAESAGICLQAGPFRTEDMAQVDSALKALMPAGGWSVEAAPSAGVWLVYMGPYPDAEFHARKLSELRRIKGLDFEELSSPPALAHGLSLGRYTTLAAAQSGLANLKLRGIRTARVVVLKPPTEMHLVRVAQAPTRVQVALSGARLPQGKAFSACRS
ncbi:MAG: hypothetical protein IIA02_09815 [Proteobacteria bacterium]|uniref:hypothetical protein n=1 Tax=Aquabacterium sp. TaxID=1872578 RepID=UPI0035C778A0|nr:hypothetical protein [Pseudomonadota bacterium]